MSGWSTSDLAAHFRRLGVTNPVEAACGEKPKLAKYRNVKVWIDGHRFDSKAEARAYVTLRTLAGIGEITHLQLQPRYELQAKFTDGQGKKHRAVQYVADFSFTRGGKRIAVDVKGIETPAFKIKRKMFAQRYPDIKLEIWK